MTTQDLDRSVQAAQTFIRDYDKAIPISCADFTAMDKGVLATAIVSGEVPNMFDKHPEVYVILRDMKAKSCAPTNIYARILHKCATDLNSLDLMTQLKCLSYLHASLCRSYLKDELCSSIPRKKLTALLSIIYSRVSLNPSASTFPIWFCELSDNIDTRELLAQIFAYNPYVFSRVKTLLVSYL